MSDNFNNDIFSINYLKELNDPELENYLLDLCKLDRDMCKFIANQEFIPKSIDDIRYFVQNNYLNLSNNSPLHINVDNQDYLINQSNFYNAYHTKIWSKLSLNDRAKVVKWHFNQSMYALNNSKIRLFFLPNEVNEDRGYFTKSNKEIYCNIDILKNDTAFETILTLEHELAHVKQYYYGCAIKDKSKYLKSLYNFACSHDIASLTAHMNAYQAKKYKNYSHMLYLRFILEYRAELFGVKFAKKINRLNNNLIGKDTFLEKEIKNYENAFKLSTKERLNKNSNNLDFIQYKISKQIDYLTKLIFVRVQINNKVLELKRQKFFSAKDINLKKFNDEIIINKTKIEKLDLVIDKFLKTGNKQKLSIEIKNQVDYFEK